MPVEIERKWLIDIDNVPDLKGVDNYNIVQGYITNEKHKCVRVRRAGPYAWLTIKGPTKHLSRPEFEYKIPWEDGQTMLDTMCDDIIGKRRYNYPGGIELDIFADDNEGLIIAEVEFRSEEDALAFVAPDWFGEDVSLDPKYFNASLAKHSYKQILKDKRWENSNTVKNVENVLI